MPPPPCLLLIGLHSPGLLSVYTCVYILWACHGTISKTFCHDFDSPFWRRARFSCQRQISCATVGKNPRPSFCQGRVKKHRHNVGSESISVPMYTRSISICIIHYVLCIISLCHVYLLCPHGGFSVGGDTCNGSHFGNWDSIQEEACQHDG